MIMICEALKNEIKTITVWLHQLCMCPPFVFPSKTRGRVKCGSTCNIIFQVDVFTFRAFTATFCVLGGELSVFYCFPLLLLIPLQKPISMHPPLSLFTDPVFDCGKKRTRWGPGHRGRGRNLCCGKLVSVWGTAS